MGQHGPALERAAELAAGHDLLPGVTTLLEIHATHGLVIEHLRHEGVGHGGPDPGYPGADLGQLPDRFRHFGRIGPRCAGRRHPQGGIRAIGRIQEQDARWPLVHPRPRGAGAPRHLGHCGPQQAAQCERIGGVGQPDLGTQHEHRQALDHGGQDVAPADQQDLDRAALETDEAREHAALGGTQGRQTRFGQAQQCEVLGQLAVQELGGILPLDADHPEMRHRGRAVKNTGHGVHYDHPMITGRQ